MNQPSDSQPEAPEEVVAPATESDTPKPARKRRAAPKVAPAEGEVAAAAEEPAAAPKPRRRKAAAAVDAPAAVDVAAAPAAAPEPLVVPAGEPAQATSATVSILSSGSIVAYATM